MDLQLTPRPLWTISIYGLIIIKWIPLPDVLSTCFLCPNYLVIELFWQKFVLPKGTYNIPKIFELFCNSALDSKALPEDAEEEEVEEQHQEANDDQEMG